jgi:hypothetical protein
MRPSLTACAVAAACLLAARAVAAQETTSNPLDTVPIRFGPIGLVPALQVRDIGRDSNVFNEPTGPKEDFTATVVPKLDVLVNSGPMLLTYQTTTEYVYYQTYTSERGINVGSSLRADFSFGPFHPFATIGGGNSRNRLNKEIDARARHFDRSGSAGLRIQLLESLSASIGVRSSRTRFDDAAEFRGERLATTLNQRIDAVEGSIGIPLTPLTTFGVAVSKERDRFDLSPGRDSDSLRIAPSLSFSPLAMLSGTASFGYRRLTTHSPEVPGYKGFVSTVTLSTTVRDRHRIDTTFSRDLQYSYEEATPQYLETALQAAWTWEVAGPIGLRLGAGRSRLHYRSPNVTADTDDDEAMTYEASVTYRIKETFRVGLNGDWRGRRSERSDDRGYDSRRIYASVTWGKQ